MPSATVGSLLISVVAVCGGGDAGVTEALYLTKLASKVVLIEAMPELTASAILKERAFAEPKLEVRCNEKVLQIIGDEKVEAIEVTQTITGKKETLKVDGVLVHVGIIPNTDYLDGIIPLDEAGQIVVNNRLETEIPSIVAAGDIRKDSPWQVAAAVGDGTIAAITRRDFASSITGAHVAPSRQSRSSPSRPLCELMASPLMLFSFLSLSSESYR